ncbi:MAG: hypothetical protein GWN64_12855 [Candidatus Thorarchaeota archaeon]|nr:hypothetical protein [Candidatus Thorarchaeota archaeon]
MIMEDRIQNLRKMYRALRNGEVDPLAVKNEITSFLQEGIGKTDPKILEEVEDMLIDLEFSIEENRCKCHRRCC